MEYREVSEIRDGMRIDWDVPIKMDDGIVLRADVYRPVADGKYPVIMSHGCYGKWLHFEDGYETCWKLMCENHPDVPTGSTNKYQSWEVCDPEKWVPDGYAVVRVDSRGSGRSPGYIEHFSPRETKDFAALHRMGRRAALVERQGRADRHLLLRRQPVAGGGACSRKHLAALCIWEGFNDFYREMTHNGGILNTMPPNWYDMQSKTVQHGLGARGLKSRMNGDLVSGPETLTAEELAANRFDLGEDYLEHPMDDEYWQATDAGPVEGQGAAAVGGQLGRPAAAHARQLRGLTSMRRRRRSGSRCTASSTGRTTTRTTASTSRSASSATILKGEKTGWDKQPKVTLNIRHPGEQFVPRAENEWPLTRTKWTKMFLEPTKTIPVGGNFRRPRARCRSRRSAMASRSCRSRCSTTRS